MKSLKAQFIGAIAMVLVAAIAMGSSTYAWFSMNQSVYADGMKVKAQTSSTLLIDVSSTTASNGRLNSGADHQTITAEATSLNPTSTTLGVNWFSATAAASNASTAITTSYSQVTDATALESYRLLNTFYLQAFDATKPTSGTYTAFAGKKIAIDKITVDFTAADQLNPSFRVLVKIGNQVVICAPTAATTSTPAWPSNDGVASVNGSGEATKSALTFATVSAVDSTTHVATLSANNIVLTSVNYNEIYTAQVFLYFDGEDAACKTDNIPTTLNDYTVTVNFALVDA